MCLWVICCYIYYMYIIPITFWKQSKDKMEIYSSNFITIPQFRPKQHLVSWIIYWTIVVVMPSVTKWYYSGMANHLPRSTFEIFVLFVQRVCLTHLLFLLENGFIINTTFTGCWLSNTTSFWQRLSLFSIFHRIPRFDAMNDQQNW